MVLLMSKIISMINGKNRPLHIWERLIIYWIRDLEVVASQIGSALQEKISLGFFRTRRDPLDMKRATKEIIRSIKKSETLRALSWLEETLFNSQKENVLTRILRALSPNKDKVV